MSNWSYGILYGLYLHMCKDHKSNCLILGFNLHGFAQDSHIVEKWKIKQEHGAWDLFPPTDQKFPTGPTKIAPKRLAVPTLFQSNFPPFSICPNPLATYKTNHLYFNEGKLLHEWC